MVGGLLLTLVLQDWPGKTISGSVSFTRREDQIGRTLGYATD